MHLRRRWAHHARAAISRRQTISHLCRKGSSLMASKRWLTRSDEPIVLDNGEAVDAARRHTLARQDSAVGRAGPREGGHRGWTATRLISVPAKLLAVVVLDAGLYATSRSTIAISRTTIHVIIVEAPVPAYCAAILVPVIGRSRMRSILIRSSSRLRVVQSCLSRVSSALRFSCLRA